MIGYHLIKNKYKLIKVLRGQSMVVPAIDAVDEIVTANNIVDGHMKNMHRARPYLKDPYESYFNPDRPFDTYFDGADIGFLCGSINGIVVVDIDPRNIKGFTSMAAFKSKIKTLYGDLPPTWTVKTARGGEHYYYRYKPEFKADKGRSISGVDFLGEGCWARLPPCSSKHGPYFWSIEPNDKTLAKLPSWIVSLGANKYHEVKPITTYNKRLDDKGVLVEKALAYIPISASYDHTTFCQIGYSLCSSGYTDLFERWSKTDSDKSKWVSRNQLAVFSKQGSVKLGTFFNIAKSYGFKYGAKT